MLRTEQGRVRVIWRLLLFALLFVVLLYPGVLLAGGSALIAQRAAALVAGLAAGWVLLALDGRRPAALGFHLRLAALREVAAGLGIGFAVALAVVALMAAVGVVRWHGDAGNLWGLLRAGVATLLFLAIPAAAEEAVFRGYPLQALAEAWGKLAALLATSLAFGLIHLSNPHMTAVGLFNVSAAGAFLGSVYLKTASLWWATGVHLGWNWAHGFAVDLPVSGLDLVDTPLIDSVIAGPPWLGGGVFGPEGGLCATLVLLLATWWLWKAPWLRASAETLATRPLAEAPSMDEPARLGTSLERTR